MDKTLKIQLDVKNNAQDLQNYMLDLNNWEEEMKRKEIALNNEKCQEASIPPPRNKIKRIKSENEKNSNKPKKISAYDYSAWDKFDVEKACADIDEEDSCEKEGPEQTVEKNMENDSKDEEDENEDDLKSKRFSLIDEAFYEKEMGNEFVKKEQWTEAIKCYTNAINLDSQNAIFYANRSLCFLKLKNFKSAETDATAAIQLDKNYVKAYQRRAFARQALGQLQEAKSDYEQILQLEPKNALARVECNKINEKLEKELQKVKTVGNKVFDHKNMFKSEEKSEIKQAVNSSKKQSVESRTIESCKKQSSKSGDLSKSESLTTKPSFDTKLNDKTSTTGVAHNVGNRKNLGSKSPVGHIERNGDGDKMAPSPSTAEKDGVFEELPEWCKIISPVNLPPHKRSKKPLKRINISFTDKKADLSCTVEEKAECSKVDDKKDEKIINKLVEKEVPKKADKAVEDEELVNERLSFEIPKTAIQFQKCWKILKKNPEAAYSYLKNIPGVELPQIFENSLESDLFGELIKFLASDEVKKEPDIVYNFLLGLSKVKRFSSLILFMSEAEKKCLKKTITELESVKLKEETSELLRLYELKV